MNNSTFLHVAREAWWLLLPLALIGLLVALGLQSLWPLVLASLIGFGIAALCRDADRAVPAQPLGLICPADGVIVHRRECHDPFADRAAIRLGIRLDRLGVYYLRAPTEGTLLEVKGSRAGGRGRQASWIRTDENDDVIVVASEGSLLGQRPCNAGIGERIGQGRRCGTRRLARRIDLYIPNNCRVDVELGQRVRAGTDVLATMVHNASKLRAANQS